MGPKKKKNVYNDFYFFMQDQKKVLRREGRGWDTMEDLASICASRWRQVPDNDKTRYKNMAKNHKEKERENLSNKFDAQGRSLLSLEEERQGEKRKNDKMIKEINEIVDAETLAKTLPLKKFFILHINELVEAGEKKFFPCEMAVIEFSLKHGISTVFHTYMSPEDHRIPMGYSFEIQQNAAESHGLPLDCAPMRMKEASSWSWIVAKFLDMVNPKRFDEAFPPLFTLSEDVEKIEIMLEAVFAWGDHKMRHDVRIYHVNELFNTISQKLSEERRFPKSGGSVFATTQLETDKFTFCPKMACNWHDYDERPAFCSLQKIKSWAYVMSKHCCEEFKIELISGRHRPIDSSEEQSNKKKKIPPIKMINIVPWSAHGEIKEDEISVAPKNNLFGNVTKTKAAPAGYTPYVPEGYGLLAKQSDKASGGGLTWADCDDDDEPVTTNQYTSTKPVQTDSPKPNKPKLNAMGKEASPAIPSPAFYVWGAPSSEEKPVSHLSTSSVNANIIVGMQNSKLSTISPIVETQKPAQKITPVPKHEPTIVEDPPLPEISQSPPINEPTTVIDDSNNFPCLVNNDNFPSLSSTTNGSSSRSKKKKGSRNKGQPLLTLGVQRMSIN